jgi:hypothetical protein
VCRRPCGPSHLQPGGALADDKARLLTHAPLLIKRTRDHGFGAAARQRVFEGLRHRQRLGIHGVVEAILGLGRIACGSTAL